jgi:serine/threonine kinase 16
VILQTTTATTTIMAQYLFDLLYTLTDCMCCFPSSPQLKINNRSFKLLRLLGEV